MTSPTRGWHDDGGQDGGDALSAEILALRLELLYERQVRGVQQREGGLQEEGGRQSEAEVQPVRVPV